MKYCVRCVIPDSRPNVVLDAEGVCNACRTHDRRREVDWGARADAFDRIVEQARERSDGHDCLIPVSGGKDSTWQVVTCLERGMTPLAVSWKPPARTEIGRQNLENLVSLGVDHVDYQVSPTVERKFLYAALVRKGDPAIPMHMALFNIPLRLAVGLRIPLVVWGENSAVEYGSTDERLQGFTLGDAWLREYGVTQGTTAADWVSEELSERELAPYHGPRAEELEAAGVTAVFLGEFFGWDPERSLRVAREHGFRSRPEGPKTGYYDYADIDDEFISIHHWLKWLKFGFTRTYDNLSLEIRNGRMTREEAVKILAERGDETPHDDIAAFCRFVGISEEHFFEVVERFRNADVWKRRDGIWVIDGFLVPGWEWK
jgi:N-acetyl sugar amidotransferase